MLTRRRCLCSAGRNLAQHYMACFQLSSPLEERALVMMPEGEFLLPQHTLLLDESAAASAIRRLRFALHWPVLRLLLVGARGAPGAHRGVELLDRDTVALVAQRVLDSECWGASPLFDATPTFQPLQR